MPLAVTRSAQYFDGVRLDLMHATAAQSAGSVQRHLAHSETFTPYTILKLYFSLNRDNPEQEDVRRCDCY